MKEVGDTRHSGIKGGGRTKHSGKKGGGGGQNIVVLIATPINL